MKATNGKQKKVRDLITIVINNKKDEKLLCFSDSFTFKIEPNSPIWERVKVGQKIPFKRILRKEA